jgi:hypothetical protein
MDRVAREARLEEEARLARRDFERLMRDTPREALDEEGWTPELHAAADRWQRASIRMGDYWMRETERLMAQSPKRDEEQT